MIECNWRMLATMVQFMGIVPIVIYFLCVSCALSTVFVHAGYATLRSLMDHGGRK